MRIARCVQWRGQRAWRGYCGESLDYFTQVETLANLRHLTAAIFTWRLRGAPLGPRIQRFVVRERQLVPQVPFNRAPPTGTYVDCD
jgi:hypothetical protein